jgi:predicted RNA-binding protein with PIN domain
MMKAKLSPNLISFVTVRRGEWILKVSVFKSRQIMVVAQHCFDMENVIVKFFTNQNTAADFIEQLVIEG